MLNHADDDVSQVDDENVTPIDRREFVKQAAGIGLPTALAGATLYSLFSGKAAAIGKAVGWDGLVQLSDSINTPTPAAGADQIGEDDNGRKRREALQHINEHMSPFYVTLTPTPKALILRIAVKENGTDIPALDALAQKLQLAFFSLPEEYHSLFPANMQVHLNIMLPFGSTSAADQTGIKQLSGSPNFIISELRYGDGKRVILHELTEAIGENTSQMKALGIPNARIDIALLAQHFPNVEILDLTGCTIMNPHATQVIFPKVSVANITGTIGLTDAEAKRCFPNATIRRLEQSMTPAQNQDRIASSNQF